MFFEIENGLFYKTKKQTSHSDADWHAVFVLDQTQDFAAELIGFAKRFYSLPEKESLNRRLAVHEAVLNAISYGGERCVLTAFGKGRLMHVEISQEKEIVWLENGPLYRGTALIRRLSAEVSFSLDKKTLILYFY